MAVTGLVVLLAQAFTAQGQAARRRPRCRSRASSGALVASVWLAAGAAAAPCWRGTLAADDFALFLQVLILAVGDLAVLLSPGYLRATGVERGEYYALLLFSIVGMLGLVSCLELVSMFVALEIMSVALYGMAGLHRDRAGEPGGGAQVLRHRRLRVRLLPLRRGPALRRRAAAPRSRASRASVGAPRRRRRLALLGRGLLLVGFGFKVASVPVPHVGAGRLRGRAHHRDRLHGGGREGGRLRRVAARVPAGSAAWPTQWQPAVAVLAIVTMLVGNLAALAQTNLKRMLAYSSVAHAGYLMTALVAAPGAATRRSSSIWSRTRP